MESDGKWVFTREQLVDTPSRRCGIEVDREASYRRQAANFIRHVGQKLSLPQLCINTAVVFMHRFYMYQSFSRFDRNVLSLAALFFVAKLKDEHGGRDKETFLRTSHSCLYRDEPPLETKSPQYEKQVEDLLFNEYVLLATLGFDFYIDHAHTHILKNSHLVNATKALTKVAHDIATSSLEFTTMCLQYKPPAVACFCLQLACQWANWEIPPPKDNKPWFHQVDETLTQDYINHLIAKFRHNVGGYFPRLQEKIMSIFFKDSPITPHPSPSHSPWRADVTPKIHSTPPDPLPPNSTPQDPVLPHPGPSGLQNPEKPPKNQFLPPQPYPHPFQRPPELPQPLLPTTHPHPPPNPQKNPSKPQEVQKLHQNPKNHHQKLQNTSKNSLPLSQPHPHPRHHHHHPYNASTKSENPSIPQNSHQKVQNSHKYLQNLTKNPPGHSHTHKHHHQHHPLDHKRNHQSPEPNYLNLVNKNNQNNEKSMEIMGSINQEIPPEVIQSNLEVSDDLLEVPDDKIDFENIFMNVVESLSSITNADTSKSSKLDNSDVGAFQELQHKPSVPSILESVDSGVFSQPLSQKSQQFSQQNVPQVSESFELDKKNQNYHKNDVFTSIFDPPEASSSDLYPSGSNNDEFRSEKKKKKKDKHKKEKKREKKERRKNSEKGEKTVLEPIKITIPREKINLFKDIDVVDMGERVEEGNRPPIKMRMGEVLKKRQREEELGGPKAKRSTGRYQGD